MSEINQLAFELENKQPFPDLDAADMHDFSEALIRIYNLMKDGKWHSATSIIEVSKSREGLRRMRDLRKRWDIGKKKIQGSRDYQYRLEFKVNFSFDINDTSRFGDQ